MKMKSIAAAVLFMSVPLAQGCTTLAAPVDVAEKTVLDEKIGIGVETAYTAAATALRFAILAGAVDDDQKTKVMLLDQQAYNLVLQTRLAYDAGNSDDYQAASKLALPVINELIALLKGN